MSSSWLVLILLTWIVIIGLINTIQGVPTTLVVTISSFELLLKFFPAKILFDPQLKFVIDLINTPLLTTFVLGATMASTLVVGMTTLNDWVTFIVARYLWISVTTIFDTLNEAELIWVWWCHMLWLPIGILCGVECGCKYTFGILLLNWMDGWIYRLCGSN